MKARQLSRQTFTILALAAATTLAAQAQITLQHLSTFHHGGFAVGAAEIAAHDPVTQRVFVVNALARTVDVLDISNPAAPAKVQTIDATQFGGAANSVAVKNCIVAVAIEATVKQDPGSVVFFDSATLAFLNKVETGALPDMLTFTPDGRFVLVANEGEPSDDYTADPEGSITIIDLKQPPAQLKKSDVRTADFRKFNDLDRAKLFAQEKIRIFGPNATVAQDLEPEYIAVSNDSKTAFVTLQEANAIAVIDIRSARVSAIRGLGIKNHALANNGFGSSNALDASDRDNAINIANWPVRGFYMPDGVAAFRSGGHDYLVLANEGDARAYTAFNEEGRAGAANYPLDPTAFPDAATLRANGAIGRLRTTLAHGDTDGDGDYDEIYTFGARSFSVRALNGQLLWDSGDQFERITAERNPAFFNSNHEANRFDDRSDDKGPEPEGLAVGTAFGKTYAFIGLERVSGVMIYDLTNPAAPAFVDYINRRDFTKNTIAPEAGDLGPEGLHFISAEESPNSQPLLVVSNEVSGTTSFFAVVQTE